MSNRENSIGSHTHTQLYTVIKSFEARLPDELTIQEGDIVEIISDDSEFDDGWYMGKNLSTGQVGLYPKIFTKIKKSSNDLVKKPSLLRSRSRRTPQSSPITANSSSYFEDSHEAPAVTHPSNNNDANVNRYVSDIDNALKELSVDKKNASSTSIVNSNDDSLNRENVENWSPYQVAEYFSNIVGAETANKFIVHKISGHILLELELAYLKELDINSFGTRFEIYKEIEELRKFQNPTLGNSSFNQNEFFNSTIRSNDNIHALASNQLNKRQSSIGSSRFSYKQTPRPQSYVELGNPNRLNSIKTSPSPLQFDNSNTDLSSDALQMTPEPIVSNEQFASPRRAPAPPSYPSPVSNNPTKFGIKSPEKLPVMTSNTIPKLTGPSHSRNTSTGAVSSIYIDTSPTVNSRRNSITVSRDESLYIDNNAKYINKTNKGHRRYSSVVINKEVDGEDNRSSNTYNEPNTPIDTVTAFERQKNTNGSPLKQANMSPNRRSVSAKEFAQIMKNKDVTNKRVVSDIAAQSTSTKTALNAPPPPTVSKSGSFRQRVGNRLNSKAQTSAFQEGIRAIKPDEALKDADYSGWMFKKGNLSIGSWKHRFFTLHKTRLSYYVTTSDSKEKGLIDITSHRVLPATEAEDKLSAVYAASAGYGRYCFKLVPPAPGSRSGLTFTQQKVHYFAVETREEMRGWMSALMKATIELDETVPAISSCVTPTIPLQKAQELMAAARENARENYENIQRIKEGRMNTTLLESDNKEQQTSYLVNDSSYDSGSPVDENETTFNTSSRRTNSSMTPTSPDSNPLRKYGKQSGSKSSSPLNGMSTPYLMTSGMISPNAVNESSTNIDSPARYASTKGYFPTVTKLDDDTPLDPPSKTLHSSNSFSKRLRSLRKSGKD